MPDEVDRDLLERFVQGDSAAFESLFRQFERDVFGWIMRIVRDTSAAEDALVEAFWRAYRGRARFDSSPLAWKYVVGFLNEEMGIA